MSTRSFALAATLAALLAAAPAARAQDFSRYGLDASVAEIKRLELLNAAVRYDPAPVIEESWKDRYEGVTVVEIGSTRGRYALFRDDEARRQDIAVRGTANLRNTAFDLEFLKSRSEKLGIYLHSGFEASALAIYADLRPRLKEGYAIRVAGHSLGAAAAIILGMLLQSDGYEVEKVLASAPPKVTDAEGWARFPRLRVLRLAEPYDPVPFLPPHSLLYGKDPYIQGGRILFLLDGRAFTVLEGSYYDDLPEAVRAAYAEGRSFEKAEHLLPAYIARLLPKEGGIEYVEPGEWQRYATESER